MKNFVVRYSLPHEHVVEVGVKANSASAAVNKAKKHFDNGTLWDDTHDMPLLRDEFEESDDGAALEFEARPVKEFPQPDASARALNFDIAAKHLVREIASGKRTTLADIVGKAKDVMAQTGARRLGECVPPCSTVNQTLPD